MTIRRLGRSKPKVTLVEIAQEAGVSTSAVSLVLNNSPRTKRISEPTQRRILEAAARLGYKPNAAAQALATGRSHTILIVAFGLWGESFLERLSGIESHLVPLGYSIRFCTVGGEHGIASYSGILGSGQADGILLAEAAAGDTRSVIDDVRGIAEEAEVPVVALADAFPAGVADVTAGIEERKGAEDAVTHLIGHGHKRIMFVGLADQRWAATRERGYRNALRKAGIAVDPELVLAGDIDSHGQAWVRDTQAWAYDITGKVFGSLDFTAVFAVNDALAVAVMSAIKDKGGSVPEDCAVIGFDDNENIARFSDPPLTTVDNPFREVGVVAAEMLVNLIDGKPTKNANLPVSLVIRRSCGCQ